MRFPEFLVSCRSSRCCARPHCSSALSHTLHAALRPGQSVPFRWRRSRRSTVTSATRHGCFGSWLPASSILAFVCAQACKIALACMQVPAPVCDCRRGNRFQARISGPAVAAAAHPAEKLSLQGGTLCNLSAASFRTWRENDHAAIRPTQQSAALARGQLCACAQLCVLDTLRCRHLCCQ